MVNWREKYTMEDELNFIKGLGKKIFFTSHELSSRIVLLQNYLKCFIIRRLDPTIDRSKIIFVLEEEIKICIDKGCSKRAHNALCPNCSV